MQFGEEQEINVDCAEDDLSAGVLQWSGEAADGDGQLPPP